MDKSLPAGMRHDYGIEMGMMRMVEM